MKPLFSLLLISATGLLPGCALPNQAYYGLSDAQAEANRHYTEKVAQEDQDLENRARMNSAAATELATRHAPSSVSTTQVFAPTFTEQ